ncbi:MAG TPA: ATP-binding protein [Chthoniobacterales bacterium]|nr:ATP-binding protein [Chthoniobacterales bacterium]
MKRAAIRTGNGGQGEGLSDTEWENLRTNFLIEDIPDDSFRRLAQQITVKRCDAGDIIFKEGEAGNCLYLIASGSVKISKKGRGGRQETLTYLPKGDFFGEMALVDSGRRSAQASAEADCVLGCLDRHAWTLLLSLAAPQVLSNFTRSVTKRLRSNNQHLIEELMRNERLSLLGSTMSSVMHDINNPLSCIRAACDILHATGQGKLTTELTTVIRDALDRMEGMTRELVEYSRGTTKLELHQTTIARLLEGLRHDFQRCDELNIRVRTEILYSGEILIDRRRMLRVFTNLIRNAADSMKNTGGGILTFRVEREGDTVSFKVSDTGCGIAPQILPKIFEPFVTFGKANGTGLGLAIVKAIVETHRGTITVQTDETGSTFEVRLPAGV